MRHDEALRYLLGLQKLGVKLGLDNIRRLLAAIGDPQLSQPTILIAGSNGKGSVAALVSAALGEAGHRTGRYTSPHLVRLEERIVVAGVELSPRRLARAVTELRAVIERMMVSGELARHPTFFEVVTALAFAEFACQAVDVAVIEVGLGGRFDATNTAEPVVSAITTIALEHTRYLGPTVADIAFEKSGVIRPGRPTVCGPMPRAAGAVVRARALATGARLIHARRVVRFTTEHAHRRGLRLDVRRTGGRQIVRVALPGRHQIDNVAVAIAILEALPPELRPAPGAIARGFAAARWPGRLEYVPGRPRLLLDGAHNPHAARALARHLREFEPGRRVLLVGCLADKDVAGLLRPLARGAHRIVLTRPNNPRAASLDVLRAHAGSGSRLVVQADLAEALATARRLAGPSGLVVACGSLYLVGDLKALLQRTA